MAKVQGVKEKVHLPIYDAFFVPEGKKFSEVMNGQRMHPVLRGCPKQNQAGNQSPGIRCPAQPERHSRRGPCAWWFPVCIGLSQKIKTLKPEFNEAELLADFINNSVTTLIVGEKVMIEMPTWFFPGGAGVISASPTVSSHGDANPRATFRFAEPVFIDPQQNFRVEILFPQGVPGHGNGNSDPHRLADAKGPIRIWVVLDGYLTRDVQ